MSTPPTQAGFPYDLVAEKLLQDHDGDPNMGRSLCPACRRQSEFGIVEQTLDFAPGARGEARLACSRGCDPAEILDCLELEEFPTSPVAELAIRSEEMPQASHSIEFLDLRRIAEEGIPEIPWIIPGWIAEQDIVLVAGPSAIGKSTTVASLAVQVASGSPWCGITPTRQFKVVYIDEEQDENTTARLFLRLCDGTPPPGLHVASGQGVRLDSTAGLANLTALIESERPDIVILDSVQQVFGSIKENDSTEVGRVYGQLFDLRNRFGVTFILVHHTKKNGEPSDGIDIVRGSTAHGTQPSTVWIAAAGNGHQILTQVKRRGAEKLSLRVDYADEGPDGRIILTGSVPTPGGGATTGRSTELQIRDFLEGRPGREATTKEIHKGCASSRPTVERTLRQMVDHGDLIRPRRGRYALPDDPGAD